MTGPTTVPWRVMTASTAAARQLMRFMTFSSSPTRSSACASQSRSPWMKNVVLPESPYGRLDDEVVAEALGQLEQLVVVAGAAEPVGHGRHAGLVAELGGDDLRVQPVAQLRARQRDLQPDLLAQLLGLLVEEDEQRQAAA